MTIQEFNEHFTVDSSYYAKDHLIEIIITHKTIPFKAINNIKLDSEFDTNQLINESIKLFNNTLKELNKIKEYGKAAYLISVENKYCIQWDNVLNRWFSVDENNNKIY